MTRPLFLILFLSISISAQVTLNTHIQILKAEDARRYDAALEKLIKSPNAAVRKRAALAAGRIGDEKALPVLIELLEKEADVNTAAMTAFAIGEIESNNGADAILQTLVDETKPREIVARALEAAGKIAAANASNEKSKQLGVAIVSTLNTELEKRAAPSIPVVRLGLTAILRARPAGAEETVRKFLAFADPDIVATALNTLARLRAKNANRDARDLLATHMHAVVRANAARVLGAADDKAAVDILIKAATTDIDSRVRVSAIRALGAIKVAKSADPLLTRGEALLATYEANLKPNLLPSELNEFIEVSNALGQILAKTGNARAIALSRDFARIDQFKTTEPYLARVKIGGIRPGSGLADGAPPPTTWQQYSTLSQVIGELAAYEPESDAAKKIKDEAPEQIRKLATAFIGADPKREPEAVMAAPDALQAFAKFKTDDLGEIARAALKNNDVQIRATAAGILADLPSSKENIDALISELEFARVNDIKANDAILATLDAIIKLDPKLTQSLEAVSKSIISPDHLVRQKVRGVLPPEIIKITSHQLLYELTPYFGKGTKIGSVLNSNIDYRRALLRKNGSVKAVLTTEKGTFTIDFLPEDAPLTVDNFVKLARAGYFNGLEVHRVVPNFVMQDGDPRGDGNGGPGWSIRCEINMVPYERGAVGMALSGKDTGGSQWFVTHSPQPHLDGGYTVFGKVNETDMKVVDNIVRGDKIISVRIIGK